MRSQRRFHKKVMKNRGKKLERRIAREAERHGVTVRRATPEELAAFVVQKQQRRKCITPNCDGACGRWHEL